MRLKEARKSAGLTQKEVAAVVGVNQNTYSYWENGKLRLIANHWLNSQSYLVLLLISFLQAPCKTTVDSVNDKPAVPKSRDTAISILRLLLVEETRPFDSLLRRRYRREQKPKTDDK